MAIQGSAMHILSIHSNMRLPQVVVHLPKLAATRRPNAECAAAASSTVGPFNPHSQHHYNFKGSKTVAGKHCRLAFASTTSRAVSCLASNFEQKVPAFLLFCRPWNAHLVGLFLCCTRYVC